VKQVNPLHIALLVVVVLAFSFFKLQEAKKEYQSLQVSYAQSEALATQLSGLKRVYGDAKRTQKELQRLLRNGVLRGATIQKNNTKGGVVLSATSLSLRQLNTLISKVLNANYKIEKLTIKKIDDAHASVVLEILW
jgi:hypothetical protein